MMVQKAGTASVISSKGMFLISVNMRAPTIIKIGAVAKAGIMLINGVNKMLTKNNMATTSALRPVLPPSAIPAAFSTYAFIAVDPIAALATVARESAISALSNP